MEKIFYKTKATVIGGREGKASFSDNPTVLQMELPKELGGVGSDKGLNPEQLFAAGFASCFTEALKLAIKRKKSDAILKHVTAEVALLERGDAFTIALELSVVFATGIEKTSADILVNEAELICPYSYAVRNNIKVSISIVID